MQVLGAYSPPPSAVQTRSSLTSGEAAVYVDPSVVPASAQVWVVGRNGTLLHWPDDTTALDSSNRAGQSASGWESVSEVDVDAFTDIHAVHGLLDTSGRAHMWVAGAAATLGYLVHDHAPPAPSATSWTPTSVVGVGRVTTTTCLRSVQMIGLVRDLQELTPAEQAVLDESGSTEPPRHPAEAADAIVVGDSGVILRCVTVERARFVRIPV